MTQNFGSSMKRKLPQLLFWKVSSNHKFLNLLSIDFPRKTSFIANIVGLEYSSICNGIWLAKICISTARIPNYWPILIYSVKYRHTIGITLLSSCLHIISFDLMVKNVILFAVEERKTLFINVRSLSRPLNVSICRIQVYSDLNKPFHVLCEMLVCIQRQLYDA